jgi:predicted DNA binding CopG/RHH family protein
MKNKKLPRFHSEKEEADFWATHSLTDYLHEFEPADVDELFLSHAELHKRIQERSEKKLISLRLAKWEIERSKEIAKKKKVPYQLLLREWIDAGLRAAFAKPVNRKVA